MLETKSSDPGGQKLNEFGYEGERPTCGSCKVTKAPPRFWREAGPEISIDGFK